MFQIKPTTQTYSDPISSIFKPGIPLGREYAVGDMCLLHTEITGSKTFLNSKVLRRAILDSKEFVEEILGLKIEDARPEEKKVEKKEKAPKVEKPVEPTVLEETPLEPTKVDTNEEVKEEQTVPEEPVVEEVIGEPKKKSKKK